MPQAQSPLLQKLHLSDAVDRTALAGDQSGIFPLGAEATKTWLVFASFFPSRITEASMSWLELNINTF